MQWLVRSALVFALVGCDTPRADEPAAAAAEAFSRQHAIQKLHAFVAGSDCRVLLVSTSSTFDDDLVESIHYGTGGYGAFGGVEQLSHDRGFRAVVYRDPAGGLWTYGATTRDEARSMPRCR
jgi:hypothetical protein